MVQFAEPWFLLLTPLAPLVSWWWLRRRRPALRFSLAAACAELPPGRANRVRRVGALLRGLAVLALVLALAGPRWPDERTPVPIEGIAVVLVLDVSGSMGEPDYPWPTGERISRLAAVQRAFHLLVEGGDGPGGTHFDGRRQDQIGIVAFAHLPENTCPLTLSHAVLLRLLDAEQPRKPGEDEADTNIGDALLWGLKRLESAGERRKVMVLLSDGEHNVGEPHLKPRQAAQFAAQQGVPVYTIDAGGPPDPNDPESADRRQAAKQSLQAVARMTGGQSFEAGDGAALLRANQEIDRMERRPIPSFFYRRYHEAFPWCALAAFACLAVASGIDGTRWLRLP
jgi:Ca-activated chloride channel family protein